MFEQPELLPQRWLGQLRRSATGAPLLPPRFVLEQGPTLQLIDLGCPEDATGATGHIPGSSFVSPAGLEAHLQGLPPEFPVVLLSGVGKTAAACALRLEAGGRSWIAALDGGLAAWRAAGLRTDRESKGLHAPWLPARPRPRSAGPLSLEDVRAHIGDPRNVRWIKATAIVGRGRLSCVDGRDDRGIIGTPGGDAGEFLLMLAALEAFNDVELDAAAVYAALVDRFDAFGDFYVHTDTQALAALGACLDADPRLYGMVEGPEDAADLRALLVRPPEDCRELLMEHLLNPAHVGCGHIRLMLEHSEAYGTRRELVESFLRAIFCSLWAGAPELHVATLPGGHEEGAVVNVRVAEEVWSMSWVPLVWPSFGGTQVFVNHPQVAQLQRDAAVDFLARVRGDVSVNSERSRAFHSLLAELATRQMNLTLGHLAKGLPVYDLTFANQRSCDVRRAGEVPG